MDLLTRGETQKSSIQEVKEIKRYSLHDLESKYPNIFEFKSNIERTNFKEVYQINKLPTKYTPSRKFKKDSSNNQSGFKKISLNNRLTKNINQGTDLKYQENSQLGIVH